MKIFITLIFLVSCSTNYTKTDFYKHKSKAKEKSILRSSVDSIKFDSFTEKYIELNYGKNSFGTVLKELNWGINTSKIDQFYLKRSLTISDMPFSIKENSEFSSYNKSYIPVDFEKIYLLNDDFRNYDYIICFGSLIIEDGTVSSKKDLQVELHKQQSEFISRNLGGHNADGILINKVRIRIHYAIIDLKTKHTMQHGFIEDTFKSKIDFNSFGKEAINEILGDFL